MNARSIDSPDGNSLSAEVGAGLRERRMERKATIAEVAAAADISTAHLGEIETGKSFCSLPVLLRLSRALEYPLSEFLPRLGGHRVKAATLGDGSGPTSLLSHSELDLQVRSIRLEGDQDLKISLDERDTMFWLLSGDCTLQISGHSVDLAIGDSADITSAHKITVRAFEPIVALLVQGPKRFRPRP